MNQVSLRGVLMNFRFVFNLILLFSFYSSLLCFKTIQEAKYYGSEHPEFPPTDNFDIENHSFNSFYKQLIPSFGDLLLNSLGLKKRYWRIFDFVDLLKKINEEKKTEKPKKIEVIQVRPGAKLVLWGEIHGAFHSFTRDLVYLKEMKIIDDNFKIIDPDTYFIFNGNVIDLGAYSLECLTLVFKLIKENPGKVFYIMGQHEYKSFWRNYSLKEQLVILGKDISDEPIPLYKPITQFFEILPLDLLVSSLGSKDLISISFFGPLHDPLDQQLKEYLDLLNKKETNNSKKYHFCAFIKGNDPTEDQYWGLSQSKSGVYRYGEGLYRLINILGSTAWTTISCPIMLYRMKNDFIYDSFCILDIEKPLSESKITVFFNEDASGSFKKGNTYNVATGNILQKGLSPKYGLEIDLNDFRYLDEKEINTRVDFLENQVNVMENLLKDYKEGVSSKHKLKKEEKIPVAFFDLPILKKLNLESKMNSNEVFEAFKELVYTFNSISEDFFRVQSLLNNYKIIKLKDDLFKVDRKNEIMIGSTLALSKSLKATGLPMEMGVSLAVNKVNKKGGIDGKFINLIFLDDEYVPILARRNINYMLDMYNCNLILYPLGTPTLQNYLDLVREKKIFVFFPEPGSTIFRDKNLTNLVNFKVSYFDEALVLTNYMVRKHPDMRYLFFYQNDDFGESHLEGAKIVMEENGIKKWESVSYEARSIYYKEAAEKIKKINPDAIGFFSGGEQIVQLIRDLGIGFLTNKILFAVSSASDEITLRILKDKGIELIFSQAVPDPGMSNIEIVREYRREIENNGLTLNVYSLEGYIVASILLNEMVKIKGQITGEKLIKNIENLKNYHFKGLDLNFDPNQRSIFHTMWIVDHGNWIEKKVKPRILKK